MQQIKDFFNNNGHGPFKIGEGRISGYISATTGLLSLLAVLCFLFPQWLTFAEFRKVYTEEFARTALLIGLSASIYTWNTEHSLK